MKADLWRQIGRFGFVGAAATLTHALIFMIGMRILIWPEQASNLAAFVIAFFLSWGGHYFWTFRADSVSTMPRFLIVALLGYALNSFFVFVMITQLALPDVSVLPLMILLTPAMTFLLARHWAFK